MNTQRGHTVQSVDMEDLSLTNSRAPFIIPRCLRYSKAPQGQAWLFFLMIVLPRHPQTSAIGIQERGPGMLSPRPTNYSSHFEL